MSTDYALLLMIAAAILIPTTFNIAENHGYKKGVAECAAKIQAAADKQATQAHAASQDYQAAKVEQSKKEQVRHVEVEKIIEKHVYRNGCFDTDGVRIINAAARGE
ncbi:MAG: hypothetical protein Q4G42_05105 [Neisseria sp.]|nr:hypothetical protein [Neisseria sp.]